MDCLHDIDHPYKIVVRNNIKFGEVIPGEYRLRGLIDDLWKKDIDS